MEERDRYDFEFFFDCLAFFDRDDVRSFYSPLLRILSVWYAKRCLDTSDDPIKQF